MAKIPELIENIDKDLETVSKEIESMKKQYLEKLVEYEKVSKIDLGSEEFKEFLRRHWKILPKGSNEWWVSVPKFVKGFHIGWLDPAYTDEAWNVFIINRYTQWLGQIPEWMREEFGFKEPERFFVVDGTLTFPEGKEEAIKQRFGSHLTTIEKGKARIKIGNEFDLIAEIIENGSLPFVPKQVDELDLREPTFMQIYNEEKETYEPLEIFSGKFNFQGDAFNKFLQYGAVGIYWVMGAGKTVIGTYIMDRIKGLKLLVVPSNTLKEQWKEFFDRNCPRLLDEVEIIHYSSYDKAKNKEWQLVIFDESQMLPANTYSKMATIRTKYRVGLSASPFREDHRTEYIFSLTGFPLGLDWGHLINVLGKSYHTVNAHIVKNLEEKLRRVRELVNMDRKTIIYTFKIDVGDRIAKMLGVPFIYGATKKRLDTIKEENVIVMSKVGDLGLSLKNLSHIIEADFLWGSRSEEIQRTGRLFHSLQKVKVHDILFTEDEFYSYSKRLHSLIERGFYLNFVGIPVRTEPTIPKERRKRKKFISPNLIQPKEPKYTDTLKRDIVNFYVKKEIANLEKAVSTVSPTEREILKLLMLNRKLPFKKISTAVGNKVTRDTIQNLTKNGLVRVDDKLGVVYNIVRKVKEDLSLYKTSDDDVKRTVERIEKMVNGV